MHGINYQNNLLVQLHGSIKWRDRPLLAQAKLAGYSIWKVPLNSIEANQRADHQVQVFILATHAAYSKMQRIIRRVRLPINLQT
jgi:hypothetical protein